jgi:triosephosphate isomerase (TIM)
MARRPFVCGNWKMHTSQREATSLASDVARGATRFREVDVAIAPPFPWLTVVFRRLEDGRVQLAAQNCHHEEKGAFTGEVAPKMLRDAGCAHVIVGHSERRALFGEGDDFVGKKVAAVLSAGLSPILCVGETLEEREGGRTLEVVERQVRGGLAEVSQERLTEITVAYEPVWAIGTGKTATPEQAQEVHAAIRGILGSLGGAAAADAIRIQYGGSVKPDNAASLMGQPDVDGALVGGASLKAEDFLAIVQAAAEQAGGRR